MPAEELSPTALKMNAVYEVELCSGERRRWQYLGGDGSSALWWRDLETAREFNEASVMYAWKIVALLASADAP